MTKIVPQYLVFIDFDGVTHPLPEICGTLRHLSDPRVGTTFFHPTNLSQINRLLDALNAHGVISSSWRLDFSWKDFQPFFHGRLIGQTPWLDMTKRITEIESFLEQNGWKHISWVALDDMQLIFHQRHLCCLLMVARGLPQRMWINFLIAKT